ncbi:MAG: FAD/NAD(P)-binding protein [Candidatus Woesearchaeota archaeon]
MKASTLNENPYQGRPHEVISNTKESSDTFTLRIKIAMKHDPGQFVQISIPGYGEAPISISSDSRQYIDLTIHQVGTLTEKLAKLKKGDKVLIRGPYGKGYPVRYFKKDSIIMIGGGCGVAPLKGVIEYIENHREDYADVHLFLGYRSPDDILFERKLEGWQKTHKLTMTVDKNPKGTSCYNASTGFVTEAIKQASIPTEKSVALLCGPPIMMTVAIKILQEKGFKDEQIFISQERLMYCAIGVCCHCMIKGKYTCIDGPVFRYDQIKDVKND